MAIALLPPFANMPAHFLIKATTLILLLNGFIACGGSDASDSTGPGTSPLEVAGPNPSVPGLTAQYFSFGHPSAPANLSFALVELNPVSGLECAFENYETVSGTDGSQYTIVKTGDLADLQVRCANPAGETSEQEISLVQKNMENSERQVAFNFEISTTSTTISNELNLRLQALMIYFDLKSELPLLLAEKYPESSLYFELGKSISESRTNDFLFLVKNDSAEWTNLKMRVASISLEGGVNFSN